MYAGEIIQANAYDKIYCKNPRPKTIQTIIKKFSG
jgi:hypothetical protein